MGNPTNYYALLGISRTAKLSEIISAYRKKALLLHPDKNKDKGEKLATKEFQEIQAAYEALKDSEKRRLYDLSLPSASASASASAGAQYTPMSNPPTRTQSATPPPNKPPAYLPKIHEINTVQLTEHMAHYMVRGLSVEDLHTLCRFVVAHLKSTNDLLKNNAEHLLSALLSLQPEERKQSEYPINQLNGIMRISFMNAVMGLYCAIPELIRPAARVYIQKNVFIYINDGHDTFKLLGLLGVILNCIFTTDLTFDRAKALIIHFNANYTQNSEEGRLIHAYIVDFINTHLYAYDQRFLNNAQCLLWGLLAAEDNSHYPHSFLSKYIFKNAYGFFYSLRNEDQDQIIEKLLKPVFVKDRKKAVEKPIAMLILNYLLKNNKAALPRFLIEIFKKHQHALDFKISKELYAQIEGQKPSPECILYYKNLLGKTELQENIALEATASANLRSWLNIDRGMLLTKTLYTQKISTGLANWLVDLNDPHTLLSLRIFISELSDDYILKHNADLLIQAFFKSQHIHKNELRLFIQDLLIMYYLKRDVPTSSVARNMLQSYFALPSEDFIYIGNQLLSEAGKLLHSLHQELTTQEAKDLITHKEYEQVFFGYTLMTQKGYLFLKLLFDFVQTHISSDNKLLAENAKKILFAGLTVDGKNEFARVKLMKFCVDAQLHDIFKEWAAGSATQYSSIPQYNPKPNNHVPPTYNKRFAQNIGARM